MGKSKQFVEKLVAIISAIWGVQLMVAIVQPPGQNPPGQIPAEPSTFVLFALGMGILIVTHDCWWEENRPKGE